MLIYQIYQRTAELDSHDKKKLQFFPTRTWQRLGCHKTFSQENTFLLLFLGRNVCTLLDFSSYCKIRSRLTTLISIHNRMNANLVVELAGRHAHFKIKHLWDHPFKMSACLRGKGCHHVLMVKRSQCIIKDHKSPS